jgi:hypothetical protein
MANKTYLELVNDVLVRLRENEVTSVNDTSYSKLISKFVNDAKRQVEDAYNWNALSETITVSTTANLFNYVLTNAGIRFRVFDVLNDSSNWFLNNAATQEMDALFLVNTPEYGSPRYYNFNGVDSNGDTQVDLYPIPDANYIVNFNVIKPQAQLSLNSDQIKVPDEPVIFLAYAKALAERGEDGGLSSSEAYALYQTSLADHVSIEGNKYPDEFTWTPT